MKLLLLAGNTFRARCYAQQLVRLTGEQIEVVGLFYGFGHRNAPNAEEDIQSERYLTQQGIFVPNLNEDARITFSKNNFSYSELETDDVNDPSIIHAIESNAPDITIFAGYGGQLLRSAHFQSDRKYLHMHPGKIPLERGSTTLYYSILNERNCTVTAFYMSEEIDFGQNIVYSEYAVPVAGVNIDVWFDNIIRADTLHKAILAILNGSGLVSDENLKSEEYYVIHPVLKHLALMSLSGYQE